MRRALQSSLEELAAPRYRPWLGALAVLLALLPLVVTIVPDGEADRIEIAFAHGTIPATMTRPADLDGWALGGVREIAMTEVDTVSDLEALHNTLRYRWAAVRSGESAVPKLFLSALPHDLDALDSVDQRKRLFFKTMLPLVVMVNEVISAKRDRILDIRARVDAGKPVAEEDRRWLHTIRQRYGVEEDGFAQLLRRVDVVPPSLALAQAAKESGWGTSRFALEGNAMYGQRVWSDDGLVPDGRPEDANFTVRAFDSLVDSVWSYAHNLNTHEAYAELRRVRAAQRAQGGPIDGYRLAGTLRSYAETGARYIDALRTIIRVNKLRALDRRQLQMEVPEIVA